jgi:hypothetical protein
MEDYDPPYHTIHLITWEVIEVSHIALDWLLVVVGFLSPYELPASVSSVEVHAGFEHVMGRGEEPSNVSVVPKDLTHSYLVLRDRLPPWNEHNVSLSSLIVSAWEGSHTRMHSTPNRESRQSFWIGVDEPDALRCQTIHVRGLDPWVPVDPNMVSPEAIQHDQYNVKHESSQLTLYHGFKEISIKTGERLMAYSAQWITGRES